MKRKIWQRILCAMLTAVLLAGSVPAEALTPARTAIPECKIPEDVLVSDLFYFASETADLSENAGTQYTLRLARGGDAAEAATVQVKIADVSAKYGRDYTVSLLGGGSKVEGAEDSVSLMDLIVGQPYTETPMMDEEEAMEQIRNDAEAREAFTEASQEAAQYIEQTTGLAFAAPANEGAMDATRRILSGDDAKVQQVSAESDMLQSIQALADVLNSAAPGAELTVPFAAGEKDKTLVIDIKDNDQSDGTRYFYLLLTEPTGSTIVSKMGCCAVTILDDEEEVLPTVSIDGVEKDEENSKYVVTLHREGLLNDMTTVRMTSSAGTGAIAGRDFAPVDTTVAFPMGMNTRKVEVPYNSDELTEDGSFTLSLSEPDGCELGTASASVTVKAGAANKLGATLGATNVQPNLAYYPTDNNRTVDLKDTHMTEVDNFKSDTYEGFDTDGYTNSYFNDAWRFGWWNKGDTAILSAVWNLTREKTVHGYEIGGAKVTWAMGSDSEAAWTIEYRNPNLVSDSYFGERYIKDGEWLASGGTQRNAVYIKGNMYAAKDKKTAYDGEPAEWSKGESEETYYFGLNDVPYLTARFKNYQGHEASAYIKSITPLYRPFELKIGDVRTTTLRGNSDSPVFNDGYGNLVPYELANFRFSDVGSFDQTIVRYGMGREGYSDVSVVPVSDQFSPLKVESWGPDTDHNGMYGAGGQTSFSFRLTDRMVNDWGREYAIKFYANYAVKSADGGSVTPAAARYGHIDLSLKTSYKNAKITVNPACINVKGTAVRDAVIRPGTMTISGTAVEESNQPVTLSSFCIGDQIRVVLTSTDPNYEPDDVLFTLPNGDYGRLSKNENEPGAFYLSGAAAYQPGTGIPRLKLEEITLTPVFKETNNTARVYLKTSDVGRFDPTSLLMTANGGSSKWDRATVDGTEYYVITVATGLSYGTIVPLTTASANSNYCVTWRQPGDPDISSRTFRGDTFYMRSRGSSEADIVFLSFEYIGADVYNTVSGTVVHNLYDLARAMPSNEVYPTEYATVAFGTNITTTNANGEFVFDQLRIGTPSVERWIRLLVTADGCDTYQDVCLTDNSMRQDSINGRSVRVYQYYAGTIRLNAAENSFARHIRLQAFNPGESGNSPLGTYITIKGESIRLELSQNGKRLYDKLDEKGKVVQKNCEESISAVKFVIKNKEGGVIRSADATQRGNVFSAELPLIEEATEEGEVMSSQYAVYPGCRIFAEIETDCAPYPKQQKTIYYNLYTGYEFVANDKITILPPQRVSPPDLGFSFNYSTQTNNTNGGSTPKLNATPKFENNIPLVGNSGGLMFNLPFVTVGMLWIGNGYRLVFGANIGSIMNRLEGSEAAGHWSGDESLRVNLPKTGSELSDSITVALKAQKTSVDGIMKAAEKAYDEASLGNPSWKFNITTGFYIDFAKIGVSATDKGLKKTDYKFIGVGGYFGVSGSFSITFYTILPAVYLPAYFGVSINADAMGFFGAAYDISTLQANPNASKYTLDDALNNAELDFAGDMEFQSSFRLSGSVRLYAGVGLAGILGIEGAFELTTVFLYQPNQIAEIESSGGSETNINLQFQVNLLVFSVPINFNLKKWRTGFFKEWDELYPKNSLALLQSGSPQAPGVMLRGAVSDAAPVWSKPAQKPMLQATLSPVRSGVLETNAYENADVQFVKLDNGKALMVYEENDTSREDPDRGVLKYVIYENGKIVSDPKDVFDDGTGDYYPSVCAMGNGKAAVAWMSVDPEVAGNFPSTDDPSYVVEYLKAQEIYYAVIDTKNDTVTDITKLTNDNFYDCFPNVAYDAERDETFVVYGKTDKQPELTQYASADDELEALMEIVNEYTNKSLTFYQYRTAEDGWCADVRTYDSGAWKDVQSNKHWKEAEYKDKAQFDELFERWKGQRILPSSLVFGDTYMDFPVITGLATTTYDHAVCMAFTVDTDGILDTAADREVYMMCYDLIEKDAGYPVRITDNGVSDELPQFACYDENEAYLCWYHDGRSVQSFNFADLLNMDEPKYGIVEKYFNNDPTKPYYEISPEFLKDQDEYTKDGTLIHTAEAGKYHELSEFFTTVEPKLAEGQTSIDMSDYQVVVNDNSTYIVWTQPIDTNERDADGNLCLCRELYAIGYCEDEEYQSGWSEPIRLTFTGSMVKYFRAVLDDSGKMYAVYNNYDERVTEQGVEISDMKLAYTILEPFGSVDVMGVSVSDTTPAVADELRIDVAVKNTGLTAADDYKLVLKAVAENGNETVIGRISGEKLYAGWSQTHEFTWTVPEDFEGVRFVASATENGYEGQNSSATSQILKYKPIFRVHDVSVSQGADGFALSVQITNEGNAPTVETDKAMLQFSGPYDLAIGRTLKERIIGSTVLPELQPGETRQITVITNPDISLFKRFGYIECLVGVSRDDENLEESVISQILYPAAPLKTLINGKAFPEKLSLEKGTSENLSTTYLPAIYDDSVSVRFTADDPSVAEVSSDKLVGVSAGTTLLHAQLLPSGIELPDIEITVTGSDTPTPPPVPHGDDDDDVSPTVSEKDTAQNDFVDVETNDYFHDAVQWAAENGITTGVDSAHFAPDLMTTRAQVVTFLWRAAGKPVVNYAMNMTDVKSGEYYTEAVRWALSEGITTGTGKTTFSPDAVCTRGQIVTFLARFAGVKDAETASVFADVKPTDYFAAAVKWAKDNGVTYGTSPTTFSPNDNCTRAQVVTFLYRWMVK